MLHGILIVVSAVLGTPGSSGLLLACGSRAPFAAVPATLGSSAARNIFMAVVRVLDSGGLLLACGSLSPSDAVPATLGSSATGVDVLGHGTLDSGGLLSACGSRTLLEAVPATLGSSATRISKMCAVVGDSISA